MHIEMLTNQEAFARQRNPASGLMLVHEIAESG
jgi:hypothetical protein